MIQGVYVPGPEWGSLRKVERVKQIPGPKTVFGPNRPWQGTQRAQARAGQSGAQRCGRLVRGWSEVTVPYRFGTGRV